MGTDNSINSNGILMLFISQVGGGKKIIILLLLQRHHLSVATLQQIQVHLNECYCSRNICLPASKTFGILLSISHFEANLSIARRISILRAIFWFGWEIYMRCNLFNLLLEKQYEIIRLTSNDQKRRLNSFCYCCTASLHTGHVKTELWRRN